MFLKLLLWGLIFFLLYKAIGFLLGGRKDLSEYGKKRDLGKGSIDDSKIEDAVFREIEKPKEKS